MNTKQTKLVSLVFRSEGEMWNAYLAYGDTVEDATKDAVLIASVRPAVLHDDARREVWNKLLTDFVSDAIEQTIGRRPTMRPETPQAAEQN